MKKMVEEKILEEQVEKSRFVTSSGMKKLISFNSYPPRSMVEHKNERIKQVQMCSLMLQSMPK